jgi:hypothetical protein
VHAIVETWDDLVDGDKPVPEGAINSAFHKALIDLPRNAFYRQHFNVLNPLIESAILDWTAANVMEHRRDGDDLRRAYVLRSNIFNLTTMAARIIGGVEWGQQVAVKQWSMLEPWAEYSKEFGGM